MPGFLSDPVVRIANQSDDAASMRTLAAAFDNDPVTRFCIRTDSHRDEVMRVCFKRILELYRPHGLTFVGNEGAGVALWARHDEWRFTFWQECALIPTYMRACGGFKRFMHLNRGLDIMKLHHPTEPHYYLYLIGVHPDYQSQGLGAALLDIMLERCDREQMPAYLEATNPCNISIYQQHGFRVIKEFSFGSGGPSLAAMWREPSTPDFSLEIFKGKRLV